VEGGQKRKTGNGHGANGIQSDIHKRLAGGVRTEGGVKRASRRIRSHNERGGETWKKIRWKKATGSHDHKQGGKEKILDKGESPLQPGWKNFSPRDKGNEEGRLPVASKKSESERNRKKKGGGVRDVKPRDKTRGTISVSDSAKERAKSR